MPRSALIMTVLRYGALCRAMFCRHAPSCLITTRVTRSARALILPISAMRALFRLAMMPLLHAAAATPAQLSPR